ncbi:MAG: hypothetical protein U0694_26315 [Anaerolineae bacterium]
MRFWITLFEECARVLRPGGILITLFPLATVPIGFHAKIPFAHWLPPGNVRINYLRAFYALHLRPKNIGKSAYETAVIWDGYIRYDTYYRFENEIAMLAEHYFESWESDSMGYVQARRDLGALSPRFSQKFVNAVLTHTPQRFLNYAISHYFGATLVMHNPRKP